jgi:hypothetical protein
VIFFHSGVCDFRICSEKGALFFGDISSGLEDIAGADGQNYISR